MLQKPKVLCIDDTPINLKLMIDLLRHDYEVKVANSATKGLELLKNFSPDIILLDIMMPEMDGYEFCQLVRQMPQLNHTPIIFITAKADPDDEQEAFNSGGNDFITKPIVPITLQARVAMHLRLAEADKKAQAAEN